MKHFSTCENVLTITITWILLGLSMLIKAQTNANWINHHGNNQQHLQWDFNENPTSLRVVPSKFSTKYGLDHGVHYPDLTQPICLNDDQGKLLIYSKGRKIYHALNPDDSIVLERLYHLADSASKQREFTYEITSAVFPTGMAEVYKVLFLQTAVKSDSVNNHWRLVQRQRCFQLEIKVTRNALEQISFTELPQLGWSVEKKRDVSYVPFFKTIPHKSPGKYWLLFNYRDSTGVIEYDIHSGFALNIQKFQTLIKFTTGIRYPQKNVIAASYRGDQLVITGFDGDTAYGNKMYLDPWQILSPHTALFRKQNTCYLYDFDNAKGVISNPRPLFESHEVFYDDYYEHYFPNKTISKPIFSPNDSLLYFQVVEKGLQDDWYKIYIYQLDIQSALKNNSKWYKFLLEEGEDLSRIRYKAEYSIRDIKLGNDGRIYILPPFSNYQPYRIKKPNVFGVGCGMEKMPDTIGVIINAPWGFISPWPDFVEPYKRSGFRHNTACSGKFTRFVNTSDSAHWVKYRLYFGDGDSMDMDNNTRLSDGTWGVEHIYPPGEYLVKLKAFKEKGGWVWYSDSIKVWQSPEANFSLEDTTGCQWVAYTYLDESKTYPTDRTHLWHWDFGDGRDTSYLNQPGNPQHVYTQSGVFDVVLRVNDGYCSDTAQFYNTVNILEAPRPGISLNPLEGCSPLKVEYNRRYTDVLDSIHWSFGEGGAQARQLSGEYTYDNPGNYQLTQKLYGPTGCITYDTAEIKVYPGFEADYVPYFIRASVEGESQVELNWEAHPSAEIYQLYRNNQLIAELTDSFYKETYEYPGANYHIRALNVCEEESPKSNPGKLIQLSGEQEENSIAFLEWTPYEEWEEGIAYYLVERYTEKMGDMGPFSFQRIATVDSSVNEVEDGEYSFQEAEETCYRVTAVSMANEAIQSHSNTLCLPYTSVVILPTAFSPNGDGINDVFKPYFQGVSFYRMRVFNRWGEKLHEGHGWDGIAKGSSVPVGMYFYEIVGSTSEGDDIYKKGIVTVLR